MRDLGLLAVLWLTTVLSAQAQPAARPTRGTVVDEAGKPIAGVAVCAYRRGEAFITADLLASALAHTDGDGRFAIAPQRPPLDQLVFVADGRVHEAGPAACVGLWPVVLPKARTLAGVVRGRDGKPIAGARVEASDWLARAPFLRGREGRFLSPSSAVRTDSSGRFVITGSCDTAMMLAIGGNGIATMVLAPVAAGDPLAVTVDRFEPTVVTVLDPVGVPAAGVRVVWWAEQRPPDASLWFSRTDVDGRAVAPVAGVTRAECSVDADPDADLCAAADIAPDVRALSLRLAPAASWLEAKGEPIAVRAVDSTGAAIDTFAAAAVRWAGTEAAATNLANSMRLCSQLLRTAQHGEAKVTPTGTGDHLQVLVDAPGQALQIVQVAAAPEVVVPLQPATVVEGRVVDGGSGIGIAGARVWTLPRLNDDEIGFVGNHGYRQIDPHIGTVLTDRDGRFRLDRVPPGELHVLCAVDGRADPPPVPISIAAHAHAAVVAITVPPLCTLTGTTDLHTVPRGLCIRLQPHGRSFSSDQDVDLRRSFPIAADGTFAISAVAAGSYDVQLLIDCGARSGLPAVVPLDRVVQMGKDTGSLALAIADRLPAPLHGRVVGRLPAERLAVISMDQDQVGQVQFGPWQLRGLVCALARDGSFGLLEPPGERTLVVCDLLTGVVLARTPPVLVVAGSGRRVELPCEAAAVTVRIDGARRAEDGYSIEVRPTLPMRSAGQRLEQMQFDSNFSGFGCHLLPAQQSATLLLPPGEFTLRVYPTDDEGREPARRSQQAEAQIMIEDTAARELALQLPAMK